MKELLEELRCRTTAIQEMQERDRESDDVTALHRQLEEKERECVDAAEANKELQKQLQERDCDGQQLETTRRGRIMEQENRVRERNSYIFNCNLNLFHIPGHVW